MSSARSSVARRALASVAGLFCLASGDGRLHRWRHVDLWLASLQADGRLGESVHQAEQAGLVFGFQARVFGVVAVALSLLVLVPWPRDGYYLALAAVYLLLGYVPFRLRRRRLAEAVKLCFVVLDVALVTVAVLMPPPAGLSLDWPVQTRIRGQEFLYVLLLLAEAALTYSPWRVLWTGSTIAAVWSLGFKIVYDLPSTTRIVAETAGDRTPDADMLRQYLDPTFVSLTQWANQVIVTAIFTILLTLAVLRSRVHLLAEVRSEAVRSDLARYMSPDVAEALTEHVSSTGFGEPATRHVAVLFADIVGFTGATERLPPEQTFALLRSFQERSARIVLSHAGTIDKYLGDGLMATFGALQKQVDAPSRAIDCAFALLAEVDLWNAKRCARQAAPMRIAVGIHYGPVVVGNLGSEQRIEFTVVGDVVNVASRLEKATRALGCALIVSEACVEAAGAVRHRARFDGTAELQVRGRDSPLAVYVAGRRPGKARPQGTMEDA